MRKFEKHDYFQIARKLKKDKIIKLIFSLDDIINGKRVKS